MPNDTTWTNRGEDGSTVERTKASVTALAIP
jgi:hypothetical protein